jgi:membrane protease subunit HflK
MAWNDNVKWGRSGGAGGFDGAREPVSGGPLRFEIKPSHLMAGFVVIPLLWLMSGFYVVNLQERVVVFVFGKLTTVSEPGLHWNVPSPLGKVVRVRTEEIKRVEIGFRSEGSEVGGPALKKESLMLTEGANIIEIQMSVQYKVRDPVKFLFGVADTGRELRDRGLYETVRDVAEAALREVVGKNVIDTILTTGKAEIQQEIHTLMQKTLDLYGAGIEISLVQLQDVHPPDEVRESFRDVNNAEEDKNRLIREAEGYYNSVIPEARGEAAQINARAESYYSQKTKGSEGEAGRFEKQLTEYRKAPDVTKKRLYIEAMEDVLSGMDKVIIDEHLAKSVSPVLPLYPFQPPRAPAPVEEKK